MTSRPSRIYPRALGLAPHYMTTQSFRDHLEDLYLIPYRWWHTTGRYALDIKHYYQRAKRGYSYRDCWSLDSYLAEVIVGGIGVLREKSHGHPGDLGSMEEWDAILAQIEEGFRLIADPDWEWKLGPDRWERPEWQAARDKIENAKHLLAEYFENLWD